MRTIIKLFTPLLVGVVISGCATNVQPWERGDLALPSMQFGAYPVNDANDDHLYFSKEATSGGRGFGGGGCGCN